MPPLGPLKLNRCPERLLKLVCFSEIFQMFWLVILFTSTYYIKLIYDPESWQTMNYKKHGLCPSQNCKSLGGCTIKWNNNFNLMQPNID